jgi:hypothetical protein
MDYVLTTADSVFPAEAWIDDVGCELGSTGIDMADDFWTCLLCSRDDACINTTIRSRSVGYYFPSKSPTK